jgi:hypothetical protein
MTTSFISRVPLFAFNMWWWVGYLSNTGSRGAVITLCIAIVCVSLFILMGATKR